jgi:hypothetical protein
MDLNLAIISIFIYYLDFIISLIIKFIFYAIIEAEFVIRVLFKPMSEHIKFYHVLPLFSFQFKKFLLKSS